MRIGSAFAAVVALAGTACAENLVWTGAADSTWEGNNWTNAAGVVQAFANGDSVRIDDSSTVRAATFNGSASVTAGDVLFDIDSDFKLTKKSGKLTEVDSFEKKGAGTLTISTPEKDAGFTFTNDIEIFEGKIFTASDCQGTRNESGLTTTALGNPFVKRRVRIHDGAELKLEAGNVFGFIARKDLLVDICVESGGTLNISNAALTSFGSLTLNGGQLLYGAGNQGSKEYGNLKICDTFTVAGSTPYTFSSGGANSWFHLNDENAKLTTTFNVEDVTGDDQFDVRFNLSLQNDITGATTSLSAGFVKTGAGTMVLANNGLNSGSAVGGVFRARVFSGDIEVREGELRLAEQNSAGDVTCRPRTLTISTNATLHLACRNAIYTPKNVPQLAVVIDHGTLRVSSDETSPTDTRSGQAFGDLTLNNATLDYADSSGNEARYGKFWFSGKVTLKGDTPYVFAPKTGVNYMGINLNNEPLTEFNVADITANDEVDVTFGHNFMDRYTDTNQMTHASGFVKTGPGTMWLKANRSTFTGNVEIREGEVIVGPTEEAFDVCKGLATQTGLGDMTVEGKTVTVFTNATLNFLQRNSLYPTTPTNNTLKSEIILNGGTLVLCRDCSADNASVNGIAKLTMINGHLDYPAGNGGWGVLCVYDTFRFAGTTPYVFPASGGGGRFLLNYYPTSRYEVEDVSGDSGDDVTFENKLKDFLGTGDVNAYAASGLIKDGPGTMRIASVCTYRGDTYVSNGVFKVDGSVSISPHTGTIYVSAGAALSGTGTVDHVSIKAGGGFEITAGQSVPLKIKGDLNLPETGFINIRNPQGFEDLDELTGVIATVTGTTAGATNIESWPVRVEGELVKTFHPYMQGNRLYVRNLNGTVILFR